MNDYILETVQSIISDAPSTLLKYYISKATNYFFTMTNQTTVPESKQFIIVDLTIIYFNKFGYEGLSNTSQNGITLNWGNDLPQDLKNSISQCSCMRWI